MKGGIPNHATVSERPRRDADDADDDDTDAGTIPLEAPWTAGQSASPSSRAARGIMPEVT